MSSKGFIGAFTKIFPVPKVLMFDFVGIDMSVDSVRVMQLKKTKFGRIPWKYKEYPLKNKCGLFESDPTSESCQEIKEVLKNIVKDFKVKYANITVPETKTYIYKTKVPKSAGGNIAQALIYNIGENVPLSPEETLIDYYVMNEGKNDIEVIVDAIPKSIIEIYTNFFESAGIKPIAFEPETHAISRGIIKKGDKNPYLVLNLDSDLSNVSVVDNGLVQYTQTLSTTNKDFENGFDNDAGKELKDTLNKVIIYWFTNRDKSDENKIQNMYLVGRSGASSDLINFLEKNLSLNVRLANVWANCFDLNEYIPQLHAKDSLLFAAATGLALKKIK